MGLLTEVRATDRVVNLMCGSGTLLIERLLLGPAGKALAIDSAPNSLAACAENLAAAGLSDRATLLRADATQPDWQRHGPFDVLLADPPWGGLMGEHATNERLHLDLRPVTS